MKIAPRLLALALLAVVPVCALDLAAFREADELVLGTVLAEAQPARFQKVRSPLNGKLLLRLPETGRQLAEDAVWGEFEPERVQLEREAVALARLLLKEKDTPGFRLEQSRAREQLVNALEELRRQSALLEKIGADSELAKLYLADEGRAGGDVASIAEMRRRLDRQAAVLADVLGYVGTARQEELELRALELKLRQQEIEQAQREDESRLKMPFAGELTLYPPRPTAGQPLRVQAGADLALIQDFSRVNVRVPLKRPEWRLLDTARLRVRFRGGVRAPLQAGFLRSLTEEVFGRDELVYYFQFTPEQTAAARPLVGGQVSAQLVLALEVRARLVPKLELVLVDPAGFRADGWAAGVAKLFPGARVLAIGETEVAVVSAAK
jgi:hypothetical protein